MNIGIYIRLSKEDNDSSESKSIISQRMYINDYIKKFNYQNVFEYVDDGYSGTNFNRPGFQQLLKDIEDKKVNVVITKDSSRLGRNISWVTYYIEEYFPSNKIRYISIDDDYDSSNNSFGEEMLIFKSLFNDYYCKDISRKIKSSLLIKKKEGKFTGWKAPYGYKRKNKDYHQIEIDKKVSNNVKEIYELFLNNYSPKEIANLFNNKNIPSPMAYCGLKKSMWTPKTIKDILSNETYIGTLVQGKRKKINYKLKKLITLPKSDWIIKENNHKPIITKKVFLKTQEKLNKYKYVRKDRNNKYELINIMYCEECGSKIGLNYKPKHSYTVCSNYKKNYSTKKCSPHTLNYNKLKEAIVNSVKSDVEEKIEIISEELLLRLFSKITISEKGEITLFLNYKNNH